MKNKTTIRILSTVLLSVILCFGTLSMFASAAGEKVVRVGYYDSGNLMTVSGSEKGGYVYEYLQMIASFTGWKYDYISGTREELTDMLIAGNIDLLPDIMQADPSASSVSLPDRAMITRSYFIASSDSSAISAASLSDAEGGIIGVSSVFERNLLNEWCEENSVKCEPVIYADAEKKLNDLKDGFIDYIVECDISAPGSICPLFALGEYKSYLAVSPSRPDLLKELNSAQFSAGTAAVSQLYSDYFSSPLNSASLTSGEENWFASKKTVTVGGILGNAPYTYLDKSGNASGIMPDLLREIFSQLGISPEIRWILYADSAELHAAAAAGEVMLTAPEYYDLNLAEQNGLVLSSSVISSGMGIVFRKTIPTGSDIVIAVPDSEYALSYVSQIWPEAKTSEFSSVFDAIDSVLLGTSDCAVALSSQLNDALSASFSDSDLNFCVLADSAEFCFASPLNDHYLISALNRGMSHVDSGMINRSFLAHSTASLSAPPVLKTFITGNLEFIILLIVLVLLLLLALFLLLRARRHRKALSDITEQMSRETAFNGLFLDTYSSVFYVNLSTGAYNIYKRSGPEMRFMRGKDFSGDLNAYIQADVHPDDREELIKVSELSNMRSMLTAGGAYTQKYRDVSLSPVGYYTLNVIRGNDMFHAAVGITDITAETADEHEQREALINSRRVLEQQLTITNGLSREYHNVWLITSTDRQLHLSRSVDEDNPDSFAHYWLKNPDYETAMNYYIDNFVAENDRDGVRFATDLNNLVNEVNDTGIFFITYSRITEENKSDFQQMCFARADDSVGNINYVLAFRDVSEVVKDELDREDQLRAANSILEGNMQQELAHKEILEQIIATRTSELLERNHALNRINDEIVEMLGEVVELRDQDSGNHVLRVKAFTYVLSRQVMIDMPEYGLTDEDVTMFAAASTLHDVGKILIPDAILLKIGPLTKEEFELMKSHCTQGCSIIRRTPKGWNEKTLNTSLDICHWHHEKWDGGGYPDGLKGDEIPISAQIVSIADCYDALTSKRVYKDAYSPERVYEMILNGECGAFSPNLLKCFVKCRKLFEKYTFNPMSFNEVFAATTTNGVSLQNINVLLVDDNDFSRDINKDILENEGAIITEASCGEDAVEIFRTSGIHFDVILMDIIMPGMDGVEATAAIRNLEQDNAEHVPIIGLTAEASDEQINRCISAGANSCMTKPLILSELTRILLSCMRSLSESMEQKLADTIKIANTDALTKVYNIAAYSDIVVELTGKMSDPSAGTEFAAVMCDVNNLKMVNDSYGHDIGDKYIINCCHIISSIYTGSPVFRIGGDEFVVILQGKDYTNRVRLLSELRKKVAAAESIADYSSGRASFASGMAVYTPGLDRSVSDVVKRADAAMYKVKHTSD